MHPAGINAKKGTPTGAALNPGATPHDTPPKYGKVEAANMTMSDGHAPVGAISLKPQNEPVTGSYAPEHVA